jgi:hypothetical protein
MSSPHRNRNEENMATMKHYVDMAMGSLYICISIYMLKIPTLAERFGKSTVYIFMALFIAYGLYRIGRGFFGIKKIMKKDR